MILKHRDTEVLRFDWVTPFGAKNVELNASAAQVAAAMKLDHVPYGLAQFKYRLCSTCPLFTSDKYGFLPARFVMSGDNAVKDVRFAEIFFFDAIVFNTDRHLGNFGFLVDNDTNKLIDRLKGLENFEFLPHPLFDMPNQRLEMSQYFLRKRIRKIIKYREKADKYLNVRRKDVTISDTIPDKLLKKAEESRQLRADLKATLKSFPRAKTAKLAILYKTTTRTIARHIKALQEAGELMRVGSRKTGYWQVIEKTIGEEKNG